MKNDSVQQHISYDEEKGLTYQNMVPNVTTASKMFIIKSLRKTD